VRKFFAIYVEPWHADIYEVGLEEKNHWKEEMRARDLFIAMVDTRFIHGKG